MPLVSMLDQIVNHATRNKTDLTFIGLLHFGELPVQQDPAGFTVSFGSSRLAASVEIGAFTSLGASPGGRPR